MDEAWQTSGRSSPEPSISTRRLLEYLLAGVIACAAIAVGIYLGFSTAMKSASSEQLLQSLNRSYLDIGDQVPDYELWNTSSRNKTSVAQCTAGRPALLLFVSKSCGACRAMSEYWDQKVFGMLRKDVVVLAIYDDSDWYGDTTLAPDDRPFPKAKSLTTDRDAQKEQDGITSTPTLIALQPDGRISLIATGFSRAVNATLLNNLW